MQQRWARVLAATLIVCLTSVGAFAQGSSTASMMANLQANVAAGRGGTFAYFGPGTGTSPLPNQKFPKRVVPDLPDLTIKTRRTFDQPNSTTDTEIVYLKGAWQRREQILEFPPMLSPPSTNRNIRITRCDERRTLELNDEARTYASLPIEDMTEHVRRLRLAADRRPPSITTGAEVKITVDVVDSGERRQIGRFTARRVVATTTTEPRPGAKTRAAKTEVDGWYIDLPPADCWDWGEGQAMIVGSVAPDRVRIEHRGTAKRGFPIEEVSHSRGNGYVSTTKVELLEFSAAALDKALFTVPHGYQPALPRLTGGFDLTRPDTLRNRLQSYWEDLVSWGQHVFRF